MTLEAAQSFALATNFTTESYLAKSTFGAQIITPQLDFEDFFHQAPPNSSLKNSLHHLSLLSQNPAYTDAIKQALCKPGNPLYRLFFGSGTLAERCDDHTSLGKVVSQYNKFMQTGKEQYSLNTLDANTIRIASLEASELLSQLVTKPQEESPSFFSRIWNGLPGPMHVSAMPVKHRHAKNHPQNPTVKKPHPFNKKNKPPIVKKEIPDINVKIGDRFIIPLNEVFEDPEGEKLTFSGHFLRSSIKKAEAFPSFIKYDAETHTLSGEAQYPLRNQFMQIRATDPHNATNSAVFRYKVLDDEEDLDPEVIVMGIFVAAMCMILHWQN